MTATEVISILEDAFGAAVVAKGATAIDPWAAVEPARLLDICRFLRDDPRLRFDLLNSICGVDYLEPDPKKLAKAGYEPHLEVVYHMMSFTHRHRFTLKLLLPRSQEKATQGPEVPSVVEVWPTADWHERETYDLFGIWFTGHPDLRRILLSEDWEGHPLRKDYEFPLEYHGIRCR